MCLATNYGEEILQSLLRKFNKNKTHDSENNKIMIGLLLLITSIALYVYGNRVWSIFIFLSFVTGVGGFSLTVDTVTGIKNEDLGFIYVVLINIYSYYFENGTYKESIDLRNVVLVFFVFMVLSIIFSIFYYEMTLIEIVQGSRQIFYFTSYFFIRKLRKTEIKKVVYLVFGITLITSVFYIWQSFTGIEILPNSARYHSSDSIGFLNRYYNTPPFLTLCIIIVLISKFHFIVKNYITMPILILALICTQGRTLIIFTAILVIIGLWLQGNLKGQVKYFVWIVVSFLFLGNVLYERFEGARSTTADIKGLVNGDFIAVVNENGDGSSMSFRFAWCLERMSYLTERPILENVFGLSLLSDQQPRVRKMYHFHIGNVDRDTKKVAQLSTPDIAYGNMLTKFGYGGSLIFMAIWICMLMLLYKSCKKDSFSFVGFIYIMLMLFVSLAGRGIFNTGNMVVPFMFVTYYLKNNKRGLLHAKLKLSKG